MEAPQMPPTQQAIVSLAPVRALALVRQSSAAPARERRRSVYLATVAHEMRNALAPLTTAMDILGLRGADVPGVGELLPVARRQMKQLAALTEDLLDLGRAATDEFRVTLKPEPLQEIVAGVAQAWTVLARLKRQEVLVEMPNAPVFVLGDRLRLGQALQNVVGNAVKFTPEGGRIAVAIVATDTEVRVRVSDSGVGIAAADLGHIFDLFYSVRSDGVPAGGFGIGLALAAKLVALHGGRITASSEGPGQGTAFTIALPRVPPIRAA